MTAPAPSETQSSDQAGRLPSCTSLACVDIVPFVHETSRGPWYFGLEHRQMASCGANLDSTIAYHFLTVMSLRDLHKAATSLGSILTRTAGVSLLLLQKNNLALNLTSQ